MANTWNEDTEKALLIAMIDCPEEGLRLKFEAAATRLGTGVSANSVRSVCLFVVSCSLLSSRILHRFCFIPRHHLHTVSTCLLRTSSILATMPWTDEDDTKLLLLTLDLATNISRATFSTAAAIMGKKTDQCRLVFKHCSWQEAVHRQSTAFPPLTLSLSTIVTIPFQ